MPGHKTKVRATRSRTLDEFLSGKSYYEITNESFRLSLREFPKRVYDVVVCNLTDDAFAGSIATRAEFMLVDTGFLLVKFPHHAFSAVCGEEVPDYVTSYVTYQLIRNCGKVN